MLDVTITDVRLAAVAGSHHAAHAAVSAAARTRIAAAKTQRPWIGALH